MPSCRRKKNGSVPMVRRELEVERYSGIPGVRMARQRMGCARRKPRNPRPGADPAPPGTEALIPTSAESAGILTAPDHARNPYFNVTLELRLRREGPGVGAGGSRRPGADGSEAYSAG